MEKTAGGELVVRYVERAPVGTPYTRVVTRMQELTRHRALAERCHLTGCDGSGSAGGGAVAGGGVG